MRLSFKVKQPQNSSRDGDNRVAVHACPYLVLRHRTPSQVLVDPNNSFLAQWDFAPLCMRMRRGSAGD
jgi:hypothetical protein